MFYSQFILAKKGPLGTIWIAAHLERKLRKNQVADTDIGVSVDSILFPEVPIALRLSSHLLLGVVRIYSRKVNYLFDDCSEALLKIKQAFRSTAVDLPPEESTAPYHSITLPETFDLDDFELPDNEIFQGNYVDHHVSSREQITLQDTMDGVVYSTSQFGLDERFGDGDTSQIGLLDEELFLDRVAASEHGGVSVADLKRSDEQQKQDPSNSEAMPMDCSGDQVEGLAANSEFVEYDQDPATPGVVGVPNLSGVNESLAGDDHVEPEHHNLTELANFECVENVSSGKANHLHGDNNVVDLSLQNDKNHDAIVSVPPENGSHIGDLAKEQSKPQGNSVHDVVSVEYKSADGTVGGPDGLDRVEDMHNGGMHSMDRTDRECAESPSCSNVTFDLEDPARRTCSSSTCVPTSDAYMENDQASHKSEFRNDAETTDNLEESFSPSKTSNPSRPLESPSRPTVIDGEAQACQEPNDSENMKKPVIHEEVSSVQVRGSDNLAAVDQNLVDLSRREEEVHASGASIEVQGEACQTQMSERALCDDQLENLNNCAMSDLPAPEKLLSALEGPIDKPSDLLGESTPDKEVFAGDEETGAGMKLISGKKRSITESTLTVESLNSVESFGRPRSRRTAESVPDDDDLLSSILVGRRSSVFKMKPTPPLEVASMKRARSAPRPSASKRKVLMDDAMVLHGDTIRQQLVNTEDIRRIRKKAPCTRPEISLIQRQFLEDEIFTEPIFTGLASDLSCLHSEAYDLRVRISEGNENHASSEVAKDPEFSVRPNVDGEGGIEGSSVPVIGGNDERAQCAGTPMQTDTQQIEHQDLNAQQDKNAVDDVAQVLQHEPLDGVMEMEIDRGNVEAANATLNEFEVSFPTSLATEDTSSMTAGKISHTVDGSMLNDASCLPPDQKMSTKPGEDAELDMRNDKGANPTEVLENVVESAVPSETESKETNEFLLEESKAGTSVEVSIDIQADCFAPIENGMNSLATVQTGEALNGAQNADEIGYGKVGVVDEAHVEGALLDHDDKDPICKGSEECKMDSTYSEEVDVVLKNASLNDGETANFQEVNAVNAEMTSLVDNQAEFEHAAVANDTEFLNVDDDELVEDDDDGMPCGDESRLLENSGWSSRTRAVAKYLQNLFEDEAVHGRKVLSMDSLLDRKTRKEASRMFFETLVLKTRDYIHVEQVKPFDNICIKPRAKLMKSDF
ncbi:sister chromatid cohesion 1 protein 4 isoform X2 [Herrania umbratica]|uniref:Sister chromatid cohesion 1 protein 4 isoform X2 n=1 Tax=Herrania umbratica TaxID=108875 RepID=A0A6J1AP95_9ROSI|nr:sister chromatid cohesion 1 protein 4 isoform X2 [Herrania umbratica]